MTTKQIQALLIYLGYNPGDADGITGVNTIAAVKVFQSTEGLAVDGDAGTATQAALLDAVANGRFYDSSASTGSTETSETGMFWDDIPHFNREEFRCKCGGEYCDGFPAEPSETLVTVAERVRDHFGEPAIVSSGVRCEKHNAAVGGVYNSRHLNGHAMDYCVQGHTAEEVLAYVQQQPEIVYSYAIDSSYVHMDIGA